MLRARRALVSKLRRLNFKEEEFALPDFKKRIKLTEESRKIEKLVDGIKDSSHLTEKIQEIYNPYKVLGIDSTANFEQITFAIEKKRNQLDQRENRLRLNDPSNHGDYHNSDLVPKINNNLVCLNFYTNILAKYAFKFQPYFLVVEN